MEASPKTDIKSDYDYTSQGFKMEYHATSKLNFINSELFLILKASLYNFRFLKTSG